MFIYLTIKQLIIFLPTPETCLGFAKYETNICCPNSFQMDGGWRFNQSTLHYVLSNKNLTLYKSWYMLIVQLVLFLLVSQAAT